MYHEVVPLVKRSAYLCTISFTILFVFLIYYIEVSLSQGYKITMYVLHLLYPMFDIKTE